MTGTADAEKGTIVGKGGDNTGGKRYGLIMSETLSGVVTLVTDDDVTKYLTDSKSVTNNDQWHFVVGQRVVPPCRFTSTGNWKIPSRFRRPTICPCTAQHNAYVGAMTLNTRRQSVQAVPWLAG